MQASSTYWGEGGYPTDRGSFCSHFYLALKFVFEKKKFVFDHYLWGFPGGSEDKVSACNPGDPGSIPGLGRSPGEGNGNPPQYSCLENPMDRGSSGLQSTGSQRVGHD